MAPEQVRGDSSSLDRRTDVHGLGATLYELLARRPPFEGESAVDVMVKVLADAPAPLRQANPAIPPDLETIVAKCLEKEPQRRYESAKALAEDLGRFLDGEPILAARPSLAYRLYKKARKNRALTAVLAASTLAVLTLSGLWLYASYRASERARIAQRFGREMEQLESTMRYAHLLPLHDTRPERALVRERIRTIEEEMRRLGASAEGAGNSAIGRAYLALDRPREGRDRLKAAWDARYPERGPATAYALGVALGRLYEEEIEKASRIPSKEIRQARLEAAGRELRAPALKFLEQGLGSRLESPAYARGLIALHEHRYDEAVAQARQALAEVPWLYEALQLEGNALVRRGQDRQDQGDQEGALKDYLAAGEVFDRALGVARSDPSLLVDAGFLHLHVMTLENLMGRPSESAFQKAVETAERALQADPDSAGARNLKAHALWEEGQLLADRGQDPTATYEEGIEAALSASRLDPQDATSYFNAGSITFRLGEFQNRSGQDPCPAWRRSIELNEKALELSSGDPLVLNSLGLAHWRLGDFEASHGRDPRTELDLAAATFTRSLSVHPLAATQSNLGNVLLTKAMWEMDQGADATATLGQAIAAYERAVEINPKLNQLYSNMGSARFMQGEQAMNSGLDPRPFLAGAVADLTRAIALNPTRPPAYFNLSTCLMVEGVYGMKKEGLDPTENFSQARQAVEKALQLRPGYYDYVRRRGELDTYQGQWEMRAGRSPEALFQSAARLLKSSVAANGQNLETWRNVAELCQGRAEWQIRRGRSPAADVREGLGAVERQMALNPKGPQAYLLMGSLEGASARWEKDPSRRADALRRAREAYAKALELNPSLKGEVEEGRSEIEKIAGTEPSGKG
jgi:serine/threonine-protein kinase